MNATIAEKASWPVAGWLGAVFLVLVLHILAIFFLSRRSSLPVTDRPQVKALFVEDVSRYPQLAEWLALHDPTVFTKTSPRGFSGVSWLQTNRLDYQATKWNKPFHWLQPAEQQLTGDFTRFVQEAVPPITIRTEKVPPAFPQVEPFVPAPPVNAVWHVEGDITLRPPVSTPSPLVNTSAAILTNTTVGVVVNSSGQALSAAVLTSSGSSSADQSAVDFAKQIWFKPEKKSAASSQELFTTGNLVFQWFPVVMAATNSTGVGP